MSDERNVEVRKGHTEVMVLMKSRNERAAAFCVGSRGASTEKVVAYSRPPPTDRMISYGMTAPSEVFSLIIEMSPTPSSISAHPAIF